MTTKDNARTVPCPKCVGSGEIEVPRDSRDPTPKSFGNWPFETKLLRLFTTGGAIYTCPSCDGTGQQDLP